MVFLGGPHQAAGRRHILLHAATCAALLLVGAVTLSGCGGGGGESNPNPTPTPITTATVRGRIIEDTTGDYIPDTVVRLGDASFTTGIDGQFSIQVPGGGAARTLIVDLPPGRFYEIGSYSGSSCVRLGVQGIPIAQGDLESGDIKEIGDIKVFSSASNLPPPPPCDF